MDDVMRQWEHYDADRDDYVTWEEFKTATFGDQPSESLYFSPAMLLPSLSPPTQTRRRCLTHTGN